MNTINLYISTDIFLMDLGSFICIKMRPYLHAKIVFSYKEIYGEFNIHIYYFIKNTYFYYRPHSN